MKYRQLTRKVEQSMLVAQQQQPSPKSDHEKVEVFHSPNPDNRVKQIQYETIIANNQTSVKKLETEREESQRVIEDLLHTNEELKKKT